MKESKNKETKDSEFISNKIHKYIIYIFLFSLIGLLIEVIYSLINHEQGFILGPLCPIYGVCAAILIRCLEKYKNKKIKAFIISMLVGIILEYLTNFILEAVFGLKFWKFEITNINFCERINTIHILVFGIIGVILTFILPVLDKFILKIKGKTRTAIDIILVFIIIVDMLFTIWGITVYNIRQKEIKEGKNYISNNTWIEQFQNNVFSDENIQKIFPRIDN